MRHTALGAGAPLVLAAPAAAAPHPGHHRHGAAPAASPAASPAARPSARPAVARPRAGLAARAIAALSAEEITDLRVGRSMAMAPPAELNANPDPLHAWDDAGALRRATRARATEPGEARGEVRTMQLVTRLGTRATLTPAQVAPRDQPRGDHAP